MVNTTFCHKLILTLLVNSSSRTVGRAGPIEIPPSAGATISMSRRTTTTTPATGRGRWKKLSLIHSVAFE